jgi:hypothetical protein
MIVTLAGFHALAAGPRPAWVFFGSPAPIQRMEPYRADAAGRRGRASDWRSYAIPNAFTIYPDARGRSWRLPVVTPETFRMVIDAGILDLHQPGYLYRLPADSFREAQPHEWVTDAPVEPVDHEVVRPGDYLERIARPVIERPPILYHGSRRQLDVLEPALPRTPGAKPVDRIRAVYASESRLHALPFALTIRPDRFGRCSWRMEWTARSLAVIIEAGTADPSRVGYLYRVPSDTFRPVSPQQWVSDVPVVPLGCEPVTLEEARSVLQITNGRERV